MFWRVFGLASLCIFPSLSMAQTESPRWRPTATLQTGISSTFQLTLGGTFGAGPAWFQRATLEFPSLLQKGDAVVVQGWATRDLPSGGQDWFWGAGYRPKGWSRGKHAVQTTLGWQRWLFPSVLSGSKDHLVIISGAYRYGWKLPLSVTADNYSLVSSPLRRGNLTYIQASTQHTLWRGRGLRLTLKHGPATTYSYQFYDRPGWRVLRYTGTLLLDSRHWTLEGSLRQQGAISPRVPDNRYWCVQLTRRL